MSIESTAQITPQVPTSEPESKNMLAGVMELVAEDMLLVNKCIAQHLDSDIVLIKSLAAYLINSGGKRLRPITLLLCTGALDCDDSRRIDLAATIEFIHTATLLHDDVVDSSELRRGNATANSVWGNEASVLVGDFLYSRAFEMMVAADSMAVMDVMAETTNRIAEGEVMQLLNAHSADLAENQYIETITRKTAKLFESAGKLAAILAGANQTDFQSLANFGMHLGIAFQIVDDLLDYSQDAEEMGKNQGDDLSEGKPTLPLIYALSQCNEKDAELIRNAIELGDRNQFHEIKRIIESTNALEYTSSRAQDEIIKAKQCLSSLPDSRYRRALEDLADFSVARTF
ncbi:MAG: octaprenyl-diphosphate synthase [Parasphingorhabdus sp.]|jgi:octaprenyl-diphosphate synthase